MESIPFDQVPEACKQLLNNATTNPRMYISLASAKLQKDGLSIVYHIEIGIESGGVVNVNNVHLAHTTLEQFNSYVVDYFKGNPHIIEFPTKKSLDVLDQTIANRTKDKIQEYFIQLLRIPGFFLFEPFLKMFGLDPSFFVI